MEVNSSVGISTSSFFLLTTLKPISPSMFYFSKHRCSENLATIGDKQGKWRHLGHTGMAMSFSDNRLIFFSSQIITEHVWPVHSVRKMLTGQTVLSQCPPCRNASWLRGNLCHSAVAFCDVINPSFNLDWVLLRWTFIYFFTREKSKTLVLFLQYVTLKSKQFSVVI